MHPGVMERAEVRIESVNSRGQGVSRVGDEKFVYFVPGALPGEFVRGRVSQIKKSYGVIEIDEITEPNPERIPPLCPFYGVCGGCSLQHASYPLQMRIKKQIVISSFRMIAGVSPDIIANCIPSPAQWSYRNKASFPVRQPGAEKIIGFFRQGSHDLVPVAKCPVLDLRLERWITPIAATLVDSKLNAYEENTHSGILRHIVIRCGNNTRSSLIVPVLRLSRTDVIDPGVKELAGSLFGRLEGVGGVSVNFNPLPGNAIFGSFSKNVFGDSSISERMKDFQVDYGPTSFFQVNTNQAISLFEIATGELEETSEGKILELYAGTGALTLFLAKGSKEVHAVEDWPESVVFLRKNLAANSMENVEALEMSSERAVRVLSGRKFDAVVMDPPRKGCSDHVLKGVCTLRPSRIVYISCNPSTLARDSVFLIRSGFTLEKIQPFDMFPQTFHVECIATFRRSGRK